INIDNESSNLQTFATKGNPIVDVRKNIEESNIIDKSDLSFIHKNEISHRKDEESTDHNETLNKGNNLIKRKKTSTLDTTKGNVSRVDSTNGQSNISKGIF
ncbi:MAG: hypothetical protein ACK56I_33625, partial [bacterium]